MQLLLIFLIIFVLFGAKKIPQLAKDLGKGIREFKKSVSGESDEEEEQPKITSENTFTYIGACADEHDRAEFFIYVSSKNQ